MNRLLWQAQEPDSLLDICRRQNLNRGLTNIPDSVFNFFIKITEMCLDMLTSQNLNTMGEKMFSECQNRIESSDLYQKFVEICSIPKDSCTVMEAVDSPDESITPQVQVIMKKLFHQIIKLQLMVMFNQFRKDTLDSLQIGKMAHRKQIRVSLKPKALKVLQKDTPRNIITQKKSKKLEILVNTDMSTTSTSNLGDEPQPGTAIAAVGAESQPGTSSTADKGDNESDIKFNVCNTIEKMR